MTAASPSDGVNTLSDEKRKRRFSAQDLEDDACAFSSDSTDAERSFREVNAESNRIYPMDMRDFRRLRDVPMPDWNGSVRRRRTTTVDDIPVVYFIQAIDGGPIKIGTSKVGNLLGRVVSIQVGNPAELKIRRLVAGDWRLERGLQSYFTAQRTRDRGEWFWPSDELEEIATSQHNPGRWHLGRNRTS